jgi:transcriptional regulator with GAF, ATPase, and Fis domain
LIGDSPAIRRLWEAIRQVADSRSTVLISGESGTGKELVARALHALSVRRVGPFIAVNCAAIPETLIESELFGHERGAFTDAHAARKGQFELADGGTLFLDEIGDLSLRAQGNLLRVLEERAFTRVGGTDPVQVDVRLVGATHVDLDTAIRRPLPRRPLLPAERRPLVVPPLRERRDDIRASSAISWRTPDRDTPAEFTPDALVWLVRYDWPGNVREMENLVEQILALADGPMIAPTTSREAASRAHAHSLDQRVRTGQVSLTDAVAAFERDLIADALERARASNRAARLLGVTRRIPNTRWTCWVSPVLRPRARHGRKAA